MQGEQAAFLLAHRRVHSNQNVVGIACFDVIIRADDVRHQISRHDRCRLELVHARLLLVVTLRFNRLKRTTVTSEEVHVRRRTMLLSVVRCFGARILIVNLALKDGSSKQGKARRA